MKTYDPSEVSLIVGGHIVEGGVEGDFVTVARDEDSFSYHSDINGGGTRSKNPNHAGKITIKLQSSSTSNEFLSSLISADELNGSGIVPVFVKDNSGNDLHVSEASYITKHPDAAYSKEVGEREYIIQCENLKMFSGGN